MFKKVKINSELSIVGNLEKIEVSKNKNIKLFKPEQCNFNIYYEYNDEEHEINIDLEDEIVKGTLLTNKGKLL